MTKSNTFSNKVIGFLTVCLFVSLGHSAFAQSNDIGGFGRAIVLRNQARLDFYLEDKGVKLGNYVFLRVLKNHNQLQLWIKQKEKFKFIRNYRICGNSKSLSDGIYQVSYGNLFQNGNNLARIGTDYPNIYNVAQNKSGSMFVSARCANAPSIGLTDPDTEELYTILYKAFKNGQRSVDLHIYPYELNPLSSITAPKNANKKLLSQLEKIYSYFEKNKKLPKILVSKTGYSMVKPKN